jgi:trimeric autotransporter adhesin
MTCARIFASSLLAMTGLGLLPGDGSAQQEPAPQLACYVPGSGTVYRIKQPNTPAMCGAGHSQFVISGGSESKGATGKGGGGGSLPTNAQGSFDLSNDNGFVAVGTIGSGVIPTTGPGTRLMWYPGRAALRAGSVDGSQWDEASIGEASTAFGWNTRAIAKWSSALGFNSVASGNAATAMGANNTASGSYSVVAGIGNVTSGKSALAAGQGTSASGVASAAIGDGVAASGDAAVALGLTTTASGIGSIAAGYYTTASGYATTAFGNVTTASGDRSTAMGNYASTNGKLGAFVVGDMSTVATINAVANNQFVVRAQRFWLGNNNAATATAGRFLETSTGGYLTTGGAWVNSSDVNRKHRFETVDGEVILDRLAALPISTWSYRLEDSTVRHLGPTAQDFRAAFSLGDTDKAIATVDADGIALAGVKALAQRTAELIRENMSLRADLDAMRADLEQLRSLLSTLSRDSR